MKHLTTILFVFVAAACTARPVGYGVYDPGDDDTVAPFVDFALPPSGDMKAPFPDPDIGEHGGGCAEYSACMVACFSDDPSSTLSGCQFSCGKMARSGAAAKWVAALECGQSWCLSGNNPDGGNYKCALSSDQSQLVDVPGAPVNTCGDCLSNSLATLFDVTCFLMSSPDCNPVSCAAVLNICLSDF